MTAEYTPRAALAPVDRTSLYLKRPSLSEVVTVALFLLLWLAPVIAAWGVSTSGRLFSFVAPNWQNQNAHIVGVGILTALATGVAIALFVITGLNEKWRPLPWVSPGRTINHGQRLFLIGAALVAAIGLFLSFDGTIFEKSYSGPSIAWLGYGAWSVTFLFLLGLLVGDYFFTRPFRARMVPLITVIFLPFLLSGSRIDFLSFMGALAVYIIFLHAGKLPMRIFGAAATLVWAGGVAIIIGTARYFSHDVASPAIIQPSVPIVMTDRMFYLSTFGDIGVSVFQVVGILQEQIHLAIGMGDALLSYATRLLPGPIFANRPGDFATQLSEPIGGGALHPLGEGYLIFGLWGCAFVGAIFGVLIALSILAGRHYRFSRSPVSLILFMLPWLLLIRGGWYQFFALMKSIEILMLLLLVLTIVGWLWKKYSSKSGGVYS